MSCHARGQFKATGYIYQGSFYAVGAEARFCPWCIANGSAAAKFDGEFNDTVGVGMGESDLPSAVINEVSQRTPSFFSFQQEQWWAHCGDAGFFLGEIEHLDRDRLGTEASQDFEHQIREAIDCEADEDWQLFLQTPSRERDVAVFVFGCLHCGRLGGYADHS